MPACSNLNCNGVLLSTSQPGIGHFLSHLIQYIHPYRHTHEDCTNRCKSKSQSRAAEACQWSTLCSNGAAPQHPQTLVCYSQNMARTYAACMLAEQVTDNKVIQRSAARDLYIDLMPFKASSRRTSASISPNSSLLLSVTSTWNRPMSGFC